MLTYTSKTAVKAVIYLASKYETTYANGKESGVARWYNENRKEIN